MRNWGWPALAALLLPAGMAAAAGYPAMTPSLVNLKGGASQQFRIEEGAQPVAGSAWSVNGIAGGNAALGRITASGMYTAPSHAPKPNEIHISAQAGPMHAWATAVVGSGPPRYKLVASWGEKGKGPGKFTDPHALCFDRQGNLIIVDATAAHVYRYTRTGRFLAEIGGGPGSAPGQFDGPRDVKLDAAGNIFIADGNNGRIQVFRPNGEYLRMFGHKGKAPGEMLRVHAIWFGRGNRLYAADVDNSRIMVFSDEGKLLFEWGKDGRGPGEFHAPHGLGGDSDGNLFVSNYWGPCQLFSAAGKFLLDFAPASTNGGPTHWHSMNSDRWGDAYLMSRDKDNRNAIMKYNRNGTLVTSWPPLRPSGEWGVKAAVIDRDGTVYASVESKGHVGIEVYREE